MQRSMHRYLIAGALLLACDEEQSKKVKDLRPDEVLQSCRDLKPTIDEFSASAAQANCVITALQSPECSDLRMRCNKTTQEGLEGDLVTGGNPFGVMLFPRFECMERAPEPDVERICEATVRDVEECYSGLTRVVRDFVDKLRCSTDLEELSPASPPDVCDKVSDDCAVLLGFHGTSETM